MEQYMSFPYLITVILNTNRREDTIACLGSLLANTYPNHQALVLDNSSTDGSVEAIRSAFPSVEIIALNDNAGYAGNNNVGIQAALDRGADWVFVLNEDTILAPNCLEQLVQAGEADGNVGIVGPMVYHFDEPEVIQSAGGTLGPYWEALHIGINERDIRQFPVTRSVDWISGCAIMVRRDAIKQVGMLDAKFFYYWEEVDWCIRVRRAGWKIVHVPGAKLWHKGVQRNYRPKPSVAYYNTRNRFLLLCKHHASFKVQAVAWVQTLRTLLSLSIRPKWRGMRDHRNALWHGLIDFLHRRWGPGRV